MTRRFLVNLFLQLACLLPYVRGYAIGDACKNYKRKNLYNEIKAAMQEAYDMAVLGYHHVAEPYDLWDNTKWELYYEASQEHLETVKGLYLELAQSPFWRLKDHVNPIVNELTIYCGDSEFISNDNYHWVDSTETIIFQQTGPLCDGEKAFTLLEHGYKVVNPTTGITEEKTVIMVFLCEALVPETDFTKDATEIEGIAPSTYAAIQRRGLLEGHPDSPFKAPEGLSFTPHLDDTLSLTMLHEMFHVVFEDRVLGGTSRDEFSGWQKCAVDPPPDGPTLDQAVINPDSATIYAATLKLTELNPDTCFMNGYVYSRKRLQEASERPEEGAQIMDWDWKNVDDDEDMDDE